MTEAVIGGKQGLQATRGIRSRRLHGVRSGWRLRENLLRITSRQKRQRVGSGAARKEKRAVQAVIACTNPCLPLILIIRFML
jgi:hypothetical protein